MDTVSWMNDTEKVLQKAGLSFAQHFERTTPSKTRGAGVRYVLMLRAVRIHGWTRPWMPRDLTLECLDDVQIVHVHVIRQP